MCSPISNRNLIDWLNTQKAVIAHWRDGALTHNSEDTDLIQNLDVHHDWLSDELVRLTDRQNIKTG